MSRTNWIDRMFSGDRLALARVISHIEGREPDHLKIMARVQQRCGRARVIGVTGPPGSGKSTLVDQMIARYRLLKEKVGVIAVDPSSPFSGGAVLGDRIRMQRHAGDDGVFIRSLGSRGNRGGLSRATREVVKLYDAFGMGVVLVETVGVGQTELDIMKIAQTTVVLLTPESGDVVQTLKAGILEIADIFVVNKSDREGADRLRAELESLVALGEGKGGWRVPVLSMQALSGQGIGELMDQVRDHQASLAGGKGGRSADGSAEEVREILLDELAKRIPLGNTKNGNPYREADRILKGISWERSGASTRRPANSSRRSSRRVRNKSTRR